MALPWVVALLPFADGSNPDPVPAENDVTAGWTALLVFVGLIIAVVVLGAASPSSCARRRPRATPACTATRRSPYPDEADVSLSRPPLLLGELLRERSGGRCATGTTARLEQDQPEPSKATTAYYYTTANVFTSGYVTGSHMIICGFFSKPDSMATVGNSAEFWIASSVYQQDGVVGVHLRRDRAEADRRTTGANLAA